MQSYWNCVCLSIMWRYTITTHGSYILWFWMVLESIIPHRKSSSITRKVFNSWKLEALRLQAITRQIGSSDSAPKDISHRRVAKRSLLVSTPGQCEVIMHPSTSNVDGHNNIINKTPKIHKWHLGYSYISLMWFKSNHIRTTSYAW